tara:strand:+ start:5932 stop:6843 length:912 start_codon:yes stop_codon:yes gene_type:complete
MNISVVIPTHNRPVNLLKVLHSIKIAARTKIKVLLLLEPNANSLPSRDDLKVFDEVLDLVIEVNKNNVGCDQSILRAYEYFNSDWIFFLGDSKQLNPLAFDIMFTHVENYPNSKAFFFNCDSNIRVTKSICSIKDLTLSEINIGDFILGGNSLFSRELITKYIKYSYRTLSSRIAHVAMPLMHLYSGGDITISSEKIIQCFLEKEAPINPGSAHAVSWASWPLICLLPIGYKNSFYLNKFIVNSFTLSERIIFLKYILLMRFRHSEKTRKLLKNILRTRYLFYSNFLEKLMIICLYFLSLIVG